MPIRALVVDDSTAMRTYVTAVLESTGDYEVEEVSNGFEALRRVPRGDFGLFVLDVNMPDINGIELIRMLRHNPHHARTPILVMTTEVNLGDAERARLVGASVVVAKPFTPEGLLDAIAQARRITAGGAA